MGRRRSLTPNLSTHKGRVRARWTSAAGPQDVDLGPADEPGVWQAAHRKLLERLAREPDAPARSAKDLIASELLAAWLASPDLAHLRTREHQKAAAELFLAHVPDQEVAEITAGQFEDWVATVAALRDDGGRQVYAESTVRARLAHVKRAWRWGVRRGLVPADRWVQIETVALRDGVARKSKKRRAADPDAVRRVLPHLRPPVRALVELQRLTGARPSELFRLRPCDVTRGGKLNIADYGTEDLDRLGVWVVVWEEHKTEGAVDLDRWIVFGKPAQKVLRPFLDRPATAFCFSPREAMEDRYRTAREKRLKAGGGSGGSRKKKTGLRTGERYTKDSLRMAVARACDRAGVPRFTPYQLRHLFGVQARDDHGLDAAQAAMGHSDPRTTMRYAKRSFALAVEVAKGG